MVEQVIEGDQTVTLHKEIVALDDPELVMVRKHRIGGPTQPPVLLVHGFAQNRYSWHTSKLSMSAWLAREGFDVWNLELRGHGRSRGSGGPERFSDYIDDIVRASKALPDRAFWIGHSLGGAALYGAATRIPDHCRGVVGIGAVYLFAQHNPTLRLLGHITWQLRNTPLMSQLQVRTRLGGKLISKLYGIVDVVGYQFPISGWWPGSVDPDVLQERLEIGFDWISVVVWQEMARWAVEGNFDDDAQWRQTNVPLLVLLGDKDHLLPPGDGRAAFDRSGSTDKMMHIFDDYHHQSHWGHLDLVLGKRAPSHVWPMISNWMKARSAQDEVG